MRKFLSLVVVALAACQTVHAPQSGNFTPQQVQVLRQNGFKQTGDDWLFSMADRLLFATDESALVPEQKVVIRRISSALTGAGIRSAQVEGHTDSTGSDAYNGALSTRRAQAVADALVTGGMTRLAMRVVGMGARIPVESNHSALGRKENRRVVIIVSPSDAAE